MAGFFEPGVLPYAPPNPADQIANAFLDYFQMHRQNELDAVNKQMAASTLLTEKAQQFGQGVRPGTAPTAPPPAAAAPADPLASRVAAPQFSFGAPSGPAGRVPQGATATMLPPTSPDVLAGMPRMIPTANMAAGAPRPAATAFPSMIPPSNSGGYGAEPRYVQLDPGHYIDTSETPFAHQEQLQQMERSLMYDQMVRNRELITGGQGYATAMRGYQQRQRDAYDAGIPFTEPPPDPRDFMGAQGAPTPAAAAPTAAAPATTLPAQPGAPASVLDAKTQAKMRAQKAASDAILARQQALEAQRQRDRIVTKQTPGAARGTGLGHDPGFTQLHQQVTAVQAQTNTARIEADNAQRAIDNAIPHMPHATPEQDAARLAGIKAQAASAKQRLDSLTAVGDQLNQRLQNYAPAGKQPANFGDAHSASPDVQAGKPPATPAVGAQSLKNAAAGGGGSTSSAAGAPHGAGADDEDARYMAAIAQIRQKFTDPAEQARRIAGAGAIYTKRTGRAPPK